MRTISFSDIIGITRTMFKSEKRLDAEIERFFKKQFSGDMLFLDHGSSALQAFIEDFQLQGSEIILPSFICSDVFVQLCIQNNITPRIVDCEKGKLGISVKDVEKVITPKTKAVIIVHVLGVPNDPLGFQKLCKKKNLLLLEDCAHCLSVKHNNRFLGSFGDAAIFSFAKEMPCFVGGAYLNNRRAIASFVRDSVKPYRFTRSDGSILLHKLPFFPRRAEEQNSQNTLHAQDYSLPPIILRNLPKIGKAIFIYYLKNLDFAEKKRRALSLYERLPSQKMCSFSKKKILSSSGKSLPLLSNERDTLLAQFISLGLHPGIGWTPVFSQNPQAQKRWKLPATPRAETYSRTLLALSLDELDDITIEAIVHLFHQK